MVTSGKNGKRRWFGRKRSETDENAGLGDYMERMKRGEVSEEEKQSLQAALREMKRELEG